MKYKGVYDAMAPPDGSNIHTTNFTSCGSKLPPMSSLAPRRTVFYLRWFTLLLRPPTPPSTPPPQDRRFERAATWMFIGAALSFVGMIHSFNISKDAVQSALGFPTASVDGQRFAVVYVGVAFIMIFFHVRDGRIV